MSTIVLAVLASALVKAQAQVQAALKTSLNKYHDYKYASAETILEVAREALNTNGLTLSLKTATFEAFAVGVEIWNCVGMLHVTYLLQHESGEEREIVSQVPVCPEKGRPLDKALFAARTEALGYACRDLLLIPREDAPDASGRADREQRQGQASKAPQRPAQAAPPRQEAPQRPAATAPKPAAPAPAPAAPPPAAAPPPEADPALAALEADALRKIADATTSSEVISPMAQALASAIPPDAKARVALAGYRRRLTLAATPAELAEVSKDIGASVKAGTFTADAANTELAPLRTERRSALGVQPTTTGAPAT